MQCASPTHVTCTFHALHVRAALASCARSIRISASLSPLTTLRTTSQPLWLIDLDDTLHRATPVIFGRMNRSMTEYVMRHIGLPEHEANNLRQQYWQRYGATLLGLMRRHGTDPRHFLHETHQFPDLHAIIDFDRAVRRWLKHLPGRRVLVSNAPRHYVMAVLRAMGIARYFDAIETIESMRFVPKPAASSLKKILVRQRAPLRRTVMIEDNLANLRTAHRLGLRTVWIAGPEERAAWSYSTKDASKDAGSTPATRAWPAHVHLRVNSVLQLTKHRKLCLPTLIK